MDLDHLPAESGAYVLEFRLGQPLELEVGRLGVRQLGAGTLRYYGSACGPGGLRSRVMRHLNPDGRRDHWHVDRLTRRVMPVRVWFEIGGDECRWVNRDLDSGRWVVAVPGFGSSDCRSCPAHLLVAR